MDKRVIKTKRNLKQTLLRLILDIPLEKITVTQICKEAETSRITFYTYYEDKYALVDEMIDDATGRLSDRYRELEQSNTAGDARQSYRNYLQSLLEAAQGSEETLIQCASPDRNPYISSALYQRLSESMASFIEEHGHDMQPKYSVKLTAALLCNSMLSVIGQCRSEGKDPAETRVIVRSVYEDLLDSKLFGK